MVLGKSYQQVINRVINTFSTATLRQGKLYQVPACLTNF